MQENDFDSISMTARFVAYWRQYTDIPFSKDVAGHIHAGEVIETFLGENHIAPSEISWYAPLFEVRYKSIVEAIRRKGIRQVIELASGLSLRGLAMTRDPAVTYIETDLESLTKEKAALVSVLRQKYALADYGNFHLSSANALDREQVLSAAGRFHKDHPIAVVSEGLFPYLTHQEMDTVVRNIRDMLQMFGGVWITPDFLFKTDSTRALASRRRVGKAIAKLTGRRLHATLFEDDGQLQAYFDASGLRVEVLNQVDLAQHVVSPGVLKLPVSIIENAKPMLHLWILTPKAIGDAVSS